MSLSTADYINQTIHISDNDKDDWRALKLNANLDSTLICMHLMVVAKRSSSERLNRGKQSVLLEVNLGSGNVKKLLQDQDV